MKNCRTCNKQINNKDTHLQCSKCRHIIKIRKCVICSKEYKRTGTRCSSCINKPRQEQQNIYRKQRYNNDEEYRQRTIKTVEKSTNKRKTKVLKYHKEYYQRIEVKNRINKYSKLPHVKNKSNSYKRKHEIDKLKACPKWLTIDQKQEMTKIYENCPKGYQVDHIIPLKGKRVRGLHVPWNLQYLLKKENNFKSNKFDGTYENNSWKEEYINE